MNQKYNYIKQTYSIHKSLIKNNNSSLNINTVQEDDKHILYFLDIKIIIPSMIIKHIQEKINLSTTKHIDIFIDGGCSGANKIVLIYNKGCYRSNCEYC